MGVLSGRFFRTLVVLVVLGLAAGAFLSFGPPGLYAKSGTPEFCASCHVMESQYEGWFHNGGHRRQKCIDCHLPNQNKVLHVTWKGIDGMYDAFQFYSGRVPETIRLSQRGAGVLQENCKRCHEETVAMINEERNCWTCHRRLSHKLTGSL